MKGNAPGKLLCLLLSGMLTTEGMVVSAAEELPASQENLAQAETEENSDSGSSNPEPESSKNDSESAKSENESESAAEMESSPTTESSTTESKSEAENSSAAESSEEFDSDSETEFSEDIDSEMESSENVDSETKTESSEEFDSEVNTESSEDVDSETKNEPTESSSEQQTETSSAAELETESNSTVEDSSMETETEFSELETETLLEEEQTETTDDEYEEQSFIFVNPLYEGIIDADKLAEQLSQQPMLFTAARESTSFSTFDEAASYLRGQMVNRNTTVSLQVPMSIVGNTEDDMRNFANNLLTTATAHTEGCSGAEGDALRWTYGASQMSFGSNSGTFNVTFTIAYYTTYDQEQELTAKVNEALSSMNLSDKTDYEKVKAIHDYICDHVDYDYTNLDNAENTIKFSAYGALCEGKAVCQGYSNAFYRMCKEVGLSVRIITGTGNGGAHAWNIVKIGNSTRAAGEYYNIDCTWDGQDTETYDRYFLLNEEDFNKDHARDAKYDTPEFHSQYPMSASSYVDPGSFEAGLNKDNPTVTFTTLDDTTVNSAANGKPKLIVFFKTDCVNSQNTIKTIAGQSFPGVDIYAAEAAPAGTGAIGKNNVASFKTTYGNDQITFSYASKDNLGNIDNFLNLFEYGKAAEITNGNSLSVTFPVLCYIDANNKFQYITQGVQNASQIQANIEHYCSSAPVEQYTITYELNGGTNNTSNPSSYSAADTVVLANPTKAGCTFDGWYRDAAFTQKVTQIAKGTSGNLTLYAKWTVIPATDKWNLDNPNYTLRDMNDDRISTTADGKPKILIFIQETCQRSKNTIKSIASSNFSNADVYVVSTVYGYNKSDFTSFIQQTAPNNKQMIFAYSGSDAWNGYVNDYAVADKNWTGQEPTPIVCYIDANDKLQYMTYGQQTADIIQTNIDKYCKDSVPDEETTYTITYILNDGENNINNPSEYTSQMGTILLKEPAKEGYTFAGWYTDPEFTNPITQITAENTGNLTLYAKWESIPQPDVPPVDPTPGDDDNKPGDDNNKPGDDVDKPSGDDNKPGDTPDDDVNKPSDDDNKPDDDVTKPGDDDKPGSDDNEPGDNNKPDDDVNKPSDDNNPGNDNPSNDDNNSGNNNNSNNDSTTGNNNSDSSSNSSNSNNNSNSSSNTAASASNNSNNNTAATLNWNQVQASVINAISQSSPNPATGIVNIDFVSTGEVNAPANVLNEIKGKNAVIAFHNGQDVAMSINGMDLSNVDLSEVGDVNLTVICDTSYIPETAFAAKAPQTLTIRQISVLNPAQLKIPVQMNIKVNTAYENQYANLYRYNPQSSALEYAHSCQIITGGYTVFPVTEGGNYLLTITAQIPETDVITAQILQETTSNLLNADEDNQYTIKPGDTLSAIAKAHGISLADLLRMNPQLTNVNKIKVNQVINVKK